MLISNRPGACCWKSARLPWYFVFACKEHRDFNKSRPITQALYSGIRDGLSGSRCCITHRPCDQRDRSRRFFIFPADTLVGGTENGPRVEDPMGTRSTAMTLLHCKRVRRCRALQRGSSTSARRVILTARWSLCRPMRPAYLFLPSTCKMISASRALVVWMISPG